MKNKFRLKTYKTQRSLIMNQKSLLIFILLVGILSCTNDNQEEFYNATECDTSDITFSATIKPIIDNNCKSCHQAGSASGILLVSYSDIKTRVDDGSLMGAIKHQSGYSPMPQGGKLDDCTISKLDAWINNGALNN